MNEKRLMTTRILFDQTVRLMSMFALSQLNVYTLENGILKIIAVTAGYTFLKNRSAYYVN